MNGCLHDHRTKINDLALQCLDLDEKNKDGWGGYEIDLLLENLSPEEVKAVVSAAVTILWPWQISVADTIGVTPCVLGDGLPDDSEDQLLGN